MMLQGVFKDYTSKDNSTFSCMEIQANVAESQHEQTRNIYQSSNTKSKCKGDTSRDKLIQEEYRGTAGECRKKMQSSAGAETRRI